MTLSYKIQWRITRFPTAGVIGFRVETYSEIWTDHFERLGSPISPVFPLFCIAVKYTREIESLMKRDYQRRLDNLSRLPIPLLIDEIGRPLMMKIPDKLESRKD